MPLFRKPIRCFVILAALVMALVAGPPTRAENVLTAREWEEDLDFLVQTVIAKHRNPFDHVSRQDFEKAAAVLRGQLASLGDDGVVVGLARLVAMLRDGHSRLTLPVDPETDPILQSSLAEAKPGFVFRSLPVKFELFSDGLRVTSASPEWKGLLGAKVLKIGSLSAAEALEAVSPVVARDSEMWVKHMAPELLRIPEVLRACGVANGPTGVAVEVGTGDGVKSVRLEPLPRGVKPSWVAWSSFPGGAAPLYLRHRDRTFWFEYLAGPRLLYIQLNAVQDDKEETLGAFAGRLRRFIDSRDVDKVVLDLRANGGGNNYLNRGLVLALSGSAKANRYGHLFTITGRATFSAAINLVSALEQWTETIFVGEPTGDSPSQYGDARTYRLPKSGLGLRLSSVYWRDWSSNENRKWVDAQLRVEPSWDDFAAGRDLALEVIQAYTVPGSLLDQLKERIHWGGMDSAYTFYYHYRNSPDTGGVRTEETLISLAGFLAGNGKESDAQDVLKYCLAQYPDSFGASLGLGQSYVRSGQATKAMEMLRKAVALRPGDPEAADWLKKAEALADRKK